MYKEAAELTRDEIFKAIIEFFAKKEVIAVIIIIAIMFLVYCLTKKGKRKRQEKAKEKLENRLK